MACRSILQYGRIIPLEAKANFPELRVLRSWEILEEATSELDLEEQILAGWWRGGSVAGGGAVPHAAVRRPCHRELGGGSWPGTSSGLCFLGFLSSSQARCSPADRLSESLWERLKNRVSRSSSN